MKKKIIISAILVLVAALSAVLLSACNNATVQGQLANVWLNHEKYTYIVTDKSSETHITGGYTVEIDYFTEGADIAFGEGNLSGKKKGYLVSGYLDINGTKISTECYFEISGEKGLLTPAASYRKTENAKGITTLFGAYDGESFNYTLTENGVKTDGSLKVAAPYYDNNEMHQVLRGASTLGDSFTFTFNMPIAAAGESETASLTATVQGTEDVSWGADQKTACYKVALSRSTKVEGISQTLFFAKDDVTINGWAVKHVLVKFVEGNVEYVLDSVEIG